MKKFFLTLNIILGCFCLYAQEFTVNTVNYSAGTRASAYSMQNRIITVKRGATLFTYFAYYDKGLSSIDLAKIAEYNNDNGNKTIVPVGDIFDEDTPQDNHGSPTIELDQNGYLHVAFGAHNSPIKYRKSIQSLFDSQLSLNTVSTITYGSNRWTYPVIKSDNSHLIHMAGSLDSENNRARQYGYLRSSPSVPWTSSLPWTDPLRNYRSQTISDNALCRYNVIMNIDINGNVHALAPAQDSDFEPLSDNYGHLQYFYYKRAFNQASFEYVNHAYQNDPNRYEEGFANIEFDPENRPHFLISIRDLPDSDSLTNNPPTGWEKWIRHFYFNGSNWIPEDIKLNGIESNPDFLNIQNAAFRIDKDGMMYILLQRNQKFGDAQDPSQILLASKSVYNTSNTWALTELTPLDGLNWQVSIEADEDKHLSKNWFYGMWQTAQGGLPGAGQNVVARKIIPCDAVIQNRAFSTYTEYLAGNEIKVGSDVKPNAPAGSVLFTSSSQTTLRAANRILFTKGFKVELGASFSAQLSNIACDQETAVVGNQRTGGLEHQKEKSLPIDIEDVEKNATSIDAASFDIYPNPNKGNISVVIGNVEGSFNLNIYDMLGRKIYLGKVILNGKGEITRTLELGNGIYIVELQNETERYLKKIMIAR